MNFSNCVLASMLVVASSSMAGAALVPFNFSATANLGLGALPAELAAVRQNDPYYISFTLDTSVADTQFSSTYAIYPNAVKDYTFTFPTRGVSLNVGTGSMTVTNGTTPFQADEYRFDISYSPTATAILWLRATSLDGSSAPSVIVNDLLPTTIDVAAFNLTQTLGMYNPNGGRPTIFSSSGLTVVPEPSGLALLPAAAVLFRRRRR